MIVNPYVLKKEKKSPTPFLQESWFEASFDGVYSNFHSITPRKSSRVDENRSLTVVKVRKTARCKQIEEESRLDPFNMREYRELINYSVRKNNNVFAAPYSPKKEWHIKIKSSKAFYPQDVPVLNEVVSKIKNLKNVEEEKMKAKFKFTTGISLAQQKERNISQI